MTLRGVAGYFRTCISWYKNGCLWNDLPLSKVEWFKIFGQIYPLVFTRYPNTWNQMIAEMSDAKIDKISPYIVYLDKKVGC